jgi:hypothetical protein
VDQRWSRWQSVAIGGVAVVAAALLWLTGDRSLTNLGLVLVSLGAAAAVAWLAPSRPITAFGVLFLVASLSGLDVSTRLGNMRLEQPAIVAGYAALLLSPSKLDLRLLRRFWPIGVAFAAYLVCLTMSSVVFAPDRADSLRMAFWTGLSICGGVLALLLLSKGTAGATEWISTSGYVQAAAGIACAVAFFTLGPVLLTGGLASPGIALPLSSLPKVYGLSWEANIYASLLAALTILGLSRFLSGDLSSRQLLLPITAGAMALGLTRGAYLGLGAGFVVFGAMALTPRRTWASDALRRVPMRSAIVAASVVLGVMASSVLMQGGRPPNQPLSFNISLPWSGSPGQTATAPAPAPAPTAGYTVPPPPDTVTFRMERIPVALADIPHSLIIGLGANSFGQRHADVSQNGAPDHIAFLALAAVYESGVVGAAGLGIGFLLILFVMFRATRRRPHRATVAAYAGALVSLLVAYETTNALNFALIWLLAGAGLAVAAQAADSEVVAHPDPQASPTSTASE